MEECIGEGCFISKVWGLRQQALQGMPGGQGLKRSDKLPNIGVVGMKADAAAKSCSM